MAPLTQQTILTIQKKLQMQSQRIPSGEEAVQAHYIHTALITQKELNFPRLIYNPTCKEIKYGTDNRFVEEKVHMAASISLPRLIHFAFRHSYLDLSKMVAFNNTSMLRRFCVPNKITALCHKTAVGCPVKIVVLSLHFFA